MADYLVLGVLVFLMNIVPVFMPPTWIILVRAIRDDTSFDPLALTVIGALSSTLGRAVLTYASSLFRRFFTHDMSEHAESIKAFFEKKGRALFAGTFAYALSPFPSNIVFIANGLTKVNFKPVFAGFFLGRLVSYYMLIVLSQRLFQFAGEQYRFLFDIFGVIAAFSILLLDWKKLFGKKKGKK
jgi:uncharacterized membrane protein YdjX (TVP38/TMEM64 family)